MAADGEKPQNLTLPDIVSSVNDAAATARNVTTAMLGTAVTLAATILASTDEAILRDQLSAPFGISASISLHVAYALMPLVFLFLHVNGLLQLHVLTERIELFEKMLKDHVPDVSERDRWRRRLHGFAFVQYFTDDELSKSNLNQLLEYIRNSLLWTVNQVSISWVPLLILIGTQVSFLRYQSAPITLLHQAVVLLDVGFITWFQVAQSRYLRRPTERPAIWVFLLLLSFVVFWLLGLNPLTAIPLMIGLLTGRMVVLTIRFLGHPWLWAGITTLAGLLAWVLVGSNLIYLCGWIAGLMVIIISANARRMFHWSEHLFLRCGGDRLVVGLGATSLFALAVVALMMERAGLIRLLAMLRRRRIRHASVAPNKPYDRMRALKATQSVVLYGFQPLIVAWFVLTQATVVSPLEAACEVRWNWDYSTQVARAETADLESFNNRGVEDDQKTVAVDSDASLDDLLNPPSTSDLVFSFVTSVLSKVSPSRIGVRLTEWNDRRSTQAKIWRNLAVKQILIPSINGSEVHCLTDDPGDTNWLKSYSVDQKTIYEIVADRAPKYTDQVANLLDRLACAKWEVGCRYLKLPSRILVSDSKAGDSIKSLAVEPEDIRKGQQRALGMLLRGRNLRFARMEQTYLYGADLRGADLTGADLSATHLQFAIASSATLRNALLKGATLDSVDLTGTRMQNVDASGAKFRGSTLTFAQLQGAIMNDADLRGAVFDGAQLVGASFVRAHLEGTWFTARLLLDAYENDSMDLSKFEERLSKKDKELYEDSAILEGVAMDDAHLQGSTFLLVELDIASFTEADLTGASFDGAEMTGARLAGATSLHASFFESELASSTGMSCAKLFFSGGADASRRLALKKSPESIWLNVVEPKLKRAEVPVVARERIHRHILKDSNSDLSPSIRSLCRIRSGSSHASADYLRASDWIRDMRNAACQEPAIAHGIVRNLWILAAVVGKEDEGPISSYAEEHATALRAWELEQQAKGNKGCFSPEDMERLSVVSQRSKW